MGTRIGVVKGPNVQRLRIKVPKRDQFPGEGAGMERTKGFLAYVTVILKCSA
jgi:hypothetical protein